MSSDEQIHQARRDAVMYSLMDRGVPRDTAEVWCDAFELEADRRGLDRRSPDYWREGAAWIAEQRKTSKLPPWPR